VQIRYEGVTVNRTAGLCDQVGSSPVRVEFLPPLLRHGVSARLIVDDRAMRFSMQQGILLGGGVCTVASEARSTAAAHAAGQETCMRSLTLSAAVSSLAGFLATPSIASAEFVGSYTVGTGSSTSRLQFDFTNGNTYLYDVRYDGSLRGDDLFAIVAEAQPGFFSYQIVSFSFGDALFAVTIGADSDAGFGTPPLYLDYWHYWTRSSDQSAWASSNVGFADRIVSDGSWDGWVFNSNSAPAALPAPAAGVLIVGAAAVAKRRRR
jgi:hypothetical protein